MTRFRSVDCKFRGSQQGTFLRDRRRLGTGSVQELCCSGDAELMGFCYVEVRGCLTASESPGAAPHMLCHRWSRA